MANAVKPDLDADRERPGFTHRRAKVGRQAGARKLGASVYEIPPDEATFPYHAHTANEEMLVVLAGRPSLRTPTGWRELEPGEVNRYPDSGKPIAATRAPGSDGEGFQEACRRDETTDYWEGEDPPRPDPA